MKTAKEIIEKARDNNEPIFIVRAKDYYSLVAVQSYDIAIQRDCVLSNDFKDEIHQICEDFVNWRFENKEQVRKPD